MSSRFVSAALCCLVAHGVATTLTGQQVHILNLALNAGEPQHDGMTLAAIIWTESSFCAHIHGIDHRAQGCAQLHQSTANQVAGRKVSRWRLTHDRRLNLHLAALYLRSCLDRFGYRGGITCFHLGIPAAARVPKRSLLHNVYLRTVLRHVRELEHLPVDED